MTKRTLSYSGILLLGLVMVSIFLNRGVAHGVANSAAISLATGSSTHILGQTIVFSGTLTFSADETDSIIVSKTLHDYVIKWSDFVIKSDHFYNRFEEISRLEM